LERARDFDATVFSDSCALATAPVTCSGVHVNRGDLSHAVRSLDGVELADDTKNRFVLFFGAPAAAIADRQPMNLIALIAVLAACADNKPDPCQPAKQAAINALDAARTATLSALAEKTGAQAKAIETQNAAKNAVRLFAHQIGQLASRYGCENEAVCCAKPRSIDGLASALGDVDVDVKDFTAAVDALGKTTGTPRAAACAKVNAEIDRVRLGQRALLDKRAADTDAAYNAGEDEVKALEADRKQLDAWHAKLPTGKPTWLDDPASAESARVKQVRTALEAYNTQCLQ
jgi:hypothetical protein